MIYLEGETGVANYRVSLYAEGSTTATQNSPYTMAETVPGLYSVIPTEPDGRYILKFSRGATELAGFERYELRDGAEATLSNTAANNSAITELLSRITTDRATKLDTVATTANAATFRATGFATPAQVAAVTTAGDARWKTATGFNTAAPDNAGITALLTRLTETRAAKLDLNLSQFNAASDVVSIGSVRNTTVSSPDDFKGAGGSGGGPVDNNAIAVAVLDALDPALDEILIEAVLSRQAQTNKVNIDRSTAIVTVLADDNVTPVFRFRTLDAVGLPSIKDAVTREVLPLS